MKDRLEFYINGQWVEPESDERIEVENPATEEVIGHVSAGTKGDIDLAVQAASEAFKTFGNTSKEERIDLLKKIITEYENRTEDFIKTISEEMGSPIWLSTAAQVTTGLRNFQETLEALESYEFEKLEGTFTIIKEPIGVVGMITPWNWPMNQITTKVSSAIATGCTMVLKPSEISPFCAMLLAEVFDAAGVPAGVFNVVNGYGPTVGAALSEHPKVDMMSFTGSTRAGIAVAQASAPTVKRVQQELGGKSANIILDDVADIEKAVKGGAGHCFLNSGQSCNAPTRMLVPNENMKIAIEAARRAAESLKIGDPADVSVDLGPVISDVQFNKIQGLIQKGIDEGATLVAGGIGLPDHLDKGYFVKVTVFANANNSMTIAREEIFGPVITLIGYDTEEEAINIANDTDYGLAGYVSSGDMDHAKDVANQIRAGQVIVNYVGGNSDTPFGGYKQSGNGREKGVWGLHDYLEIKAITGF